MEGESCPICDSTEFLEYGGRPGALCTGCHALERHRELVRTASDILSPGEGRVCLEIAPASPELFGGFLRRLGWAYLSGDKWRTGNPHDPRSAGFVDFEVDVADMSMFEDGRFDLFIAQHVIEEVPAYESALTEVRRVLAPGGVALLEIPYDPAMGESQPQPPDVFGNVWRFGRDLGERVSALFSNVEKRPLELGQYRGELMVCRT